MKVAIGTAAGIAVLALAGCDELPRSSAPASLSSSAPVDASAPSGRPTSTPRPKPSAESKVTASERVAPSRPDKPEMDPGRIAFDGEQPREDLAIRPAVYTGEPGTGAQKAAYTAEPRPDTLAIKEPPAPQDIDQAAQSAKIKEVMLGSKVPGFLGKPSEKIVDKVLEESNKQGMDPMLVLAVMDTESAFDPRAVSYADARGLMQIMPGTGANLEGMNPKTYDADRLFDVSRNVHLGVKYLRMLWDQFCQVGMEAVRTLDPMKLKGLQEVLMSYNCGPNRSWWQKVKLSWNYMTAIVGKYVKLRYMVYRQPSPGPVQA